MPKQNATPTLAIHSTAVILLPPFLWPALAYCTAEALMRKLRHSRLDAGSRCYYLRCQAEGCLPESGDPASGKMISFVYWSARLSDPKTISASGKTQEEAIMLLNHKDALKFVLDNPDYMNALTIQRIEDIHSILTKELAGDSIAVIHTAVL